jgi:ribose-phosphate pyrophosphokinase
VRNRRFAKYLGVLDFSLDKRRDENGIEILKVTCAEELAGKIVLLFDDELASGETSITAAEKILECGAKAVYIVITHHIACEKNGKSAEGKFEEAYIKCGVKVVTTNTIPRPKEYLKENSPWLTVVPIDKVLAHTIYEGTLIGGSISGIFEKSK